MNSFHSFPPSSFLPLLIFFFTNLIVSSHLYSDCTSSFNCGTITNLTYPFWGRTRPVSCGHPDLKLECEQNMATIEIMKVKYHILEAKPNSKILKLSRQDFIDGSFCRPQFINTTLDPTLFEYGPPGYVNLTLLYGCAPLFVSVPGQFSCPGFGIGYMELGFYVGLGTCNVSVVIPVLEEGLLMKLWDLRKMNEVIKQGFYVKLKVESDCEECLKSGGVCGYDPKLNQPTCYCRDSPRRSKTCPTSTSSVNGASQVPKIPPEAQKKNQKPLKIGLAIGAVFLLAIFVACWSFYIKQRKKYVLQSKDLSTPPSSKENNNNNVSTTLITTNLSLTRSIPPYPSSTLSLQNRSSYFGAQVFSYMDLQKATDNFHPSRELGNGGYGTVYYGKLDDGREVAVKCLYENNFKRVEQFMNEVEILTRLQDRNLVKLYGCTSRHGQELLLVYEYIPNGTVADHIHGNKRTNPGPLTWPVRLNIAVETAHALAYLHRSDIIHRDVKTSNILLDNKFHVKVADFGLCRLFPLDVSHVSTAPQGTPGYVDPEYYQCYQLTDRSDVFSFGVVLIELISSLQAVDTSRHRHDINLANMAVNKIQNHALDELVDPSLGFDRDYGVRQMVTSVAELAFRCLQQNREMRPSMEEVVDVLRRIGDEKLGAEKAEVVDVGADDVGLLKHMLPPLSPVSVVNDKWVFLNRTV